MSTTAAVDGEPLWRLEGAAAIYAREVWPDGPGADLWAEEMIRSMPGAEIEWKRGVVATFGGAQRPLRALEYGRHRIARDAQAVIDAAVLSKQLPLFNPLQQSTSEVVGAFVRRSNVLALLAAQPVQLVPRAEASGANDLSPSLLSADSRGVDDARVLMQFREEKMLRKHGALNRLAAKDGRSRQRLSEIIKRAETAERAAAGSIAVIIRSVTK
jgi:hypothetical protein